MALATAMAGEVVLSAQPGEVVRRARTRYGFTQEWLSNHLGVRRESLSRIESGHSKPTMDVVARFARIMALAQGVRDLAARLERDGRVPGSLMLRPLAEGLELDPGTVDEVARAALHSYTEKRRSLLEGLR